MEEVMVAYLFSKNYRRNMTYKPTWAANIQC